MLMVVKDVHVLVQAHPRTRRGACLSYQREVRWSFQKPIKAASASNAPAR